MLRHPLRRTVVLLVLWLVPLHLLFAINPNEAPGFPTHATQLQGPGGDSISAFSGDLELSVPIGPTWELPGMSWGLSLHYSSKLWRLWTNQGETGNDGTLSRRGPFGVGWRLTMGRVFVSCREACTGFEPVYFEDAAGTYHPVRLDTAGWWPGQNPVRGETTDGTYMRVEAWLTDSNLAIGANNVASIKIFPGNGVVLIFSTKLADAAVHSSTVAGSRDDHRGWHLTRMQKQGPSGDPNTPYSWVDVTYETTPGLEHCIKEIRDGHVGLTGTFRTITFTNAATLGGVTVEGGYTTAISMPAVVGQAATTATYTFDYALQTMSLSEGSDPNSPYYLTATHANQLTLTKINLPKDPSWAANYSYSFAYDPATGELAQQTLPTGGTVAYSHRTYNFAIALQLIYVREVTQKRVTTGGSTYVWDYTRWRGSLTGIVTQWMLLTDPFGNQTKYIFYGPDPSDPNWSPGLTKAVAVYAGAPFNSWGSVQARGAQAHTVSYKYQNFGTPGKDDIRLTETTPVWGDVGSARSAVVHSGALPYGRFSKSEEYGFESASFPERTIEREYDPDPDPNASPARWSNWVTQALKRETLKDRDGAVVRRSEWTWLDDGRPATSRRLVDPNGASSGDLLTTYSYDPATGLPDVTRVEGGDANTPYATRSYFTGPYLTGRKTLRRNGVPFGYFSFNVQRDAKTGAILTSWDPSGIATSFQYDLLGRVTRIVPSGTERPTEITYVDLRKTKTLRGPATGDRVESWSYLDDLGRAAESRRVTGPGTESAQFICYDAAGRPTFVSEWHVPPSNSAPGSPTCPPGSNGPKGTTFDYASLRESAWEEDSIGDYIGGQFFATDPMGRVHKVTGADGSRTETDYQALDTTVRSFNINGSPSANTGLSAVTGFQRDARGRLTYVDAPEGADGRYTYDAAGNLTRVELLEQPAYGAPFIQVRSFTYDFLGRLRSSTNPESGTVLHAKYDSGGNVVEKVESDGTKFTMEYDEAGRLLSVTSARRDPSGAYLPPVLLARYTYDEPGVVNGAGRLTQVESFDETGRLVARKRLRFEGLNGRPSHELTRFALWDGRDGEGAGDPELTACYGYDDSGLLTSLRYPSQAACTQPDANVATLAYRYSYGQLRGVNDSRRNALPVASDPATWKLIQDVQYNPAGGLQVLGYANGVTTTITPDDLMRPKQIVVQGPGGGPSSKYLDEGVYAYDGAGNIRAIGADTFSYDRIGRLVSASLSYNSQTYQRSWTYDAFGNILREDRTDPGGAQSAKVFQVDPFTNRIVNLGNPAASFIYDQRGNLNREEAQRYLFDDRNRLLTVKKDANLHPAGSYAYDAAGMKFLKEDPATGRRIFYVRDGGGSVLSELIPSGAGLSEGFWQKDYFYVLGRVIGQAEEKVPKPVEGLTSSLSVSGGSTSVTLSWASVSDGDVASYRIYKKDPGASGWTLAGTTTGPSATSWGEMLPPGAGPYFYRVAAVGSAGEGVTSRGVRIEPAVGLAAPDPNAVALTATATPFSVTLRWNRIPEDADGLASEPATTFLGYKLYRRDTTTDPNAPVVLLSPTPLRGTVFHDLGVEEGRTYVYELHAVGTSGQETAGVAASAQPLDGTAPSVPQGVRAWSGPGAGQLTLTWAPNTEDDLAGYHLWREVSGGQWEIVATLGPLATQATDPNLPERVTYRYRLSAFDARNESALSASVSARPRVSSPGAPQITAGEAWLGWYGGSGYLQYLGPGWDESQYSAFRIYKKEEGLPQDRWELVFTDPVTHTANGDVFIGRYVDPWANRCRVTEYVVVGVDLQGDETVDAPLREVRYFLVPGPPIPSTSGSNLRFDVAGFVGCSTVGNGFKVLSWKLYQDGPNFSWTPVTFDPNVGYVEVPKPGPNETWSYRLTARVQNLYQTTDPNFPVTIDTYSSMDICVDSQGNIDPDDTHCRDTDGSQPHPPPGGGGPPPPECGGTNGGNCAGGPESKNDAWQWTSQATNGVKGVRLRAEGNYARMQQPPGDRRPDDLFPGLREEAAPGEGGWVVATARRPGAIPEPVVTVAARVPSSRVASPGPAAAHFPAPHAATQDLGAPGVVLDDTRIEESGSGGAARGSSSSGPGRTIFEEDALTQVARILDDLFSMPASWEGTPDRSTASFGVPRGTPGSATAWMARDAAASFDPLTHSSDPSRQFLGSFTSHGGAALLAGGLNIGHFLITGSSPKSFTWQFFSWDHLGSVRLVTSETGTLLWSTKYLPFGEETPDPFRSASGNTHRFTGHERDFEDDMDYMFARHYDLATFRFLSADFLPGGAPRLQSHNLYAYVNGNPSNLVDPFGLSPYRGPVQDVIFDSGSQRTIGWDDRPAPSWGSIIGSCGALCGGASSSATGSAGEYDGPKDLDFSQGTSDSDDPSGTGFVERITVWGKGAIVALESLQNISTIGPFGSERSTHQAGGLRRLNPWTWNSPGEDLNIKGLWRDIYDVDWAATKAAVQLMPVGALGRVVSLYGAKWPIVGRSSLLFGKSLGLLNNNPYVRVGWGWFQDIESVIFRLSLGGRGSWIWWHLNF